MGAQVLIPSVTAVARNTQVLCSAVLCRRLPRLYTRCDLNQLSRGKYPPTMYVSPINSLTPSVSVPISTLPVPCVRAGVPGARRVLQHGLRSWLESD